LLVSSNQKNLFRTEPSLENFIKPPCPKNNMEEKKKKTEEKEEENPTDLTEDETEDDFLIN
jgi:hypothetical protein